MRIIGGKYRGLKLVSFDGEDVRPTADRVKESLFNILSVSVVGATVCDLFCGSGNLGIESLSRGAKETHFNDCARSSLAILKGNLSKLKGGERYFVTCNDFKTFLMTTDKKFDIIFIDPPYRFDYGAEALEIIAKRQLLSEDGIAVYERDRAFEGHICGIERYDERKYGKTYLTFFRGDKQ